MRPISNEVQYLVDNDPVLNQLILDIGGHGRSLEVLWDVLTSKRGIKNIDFLYLFKTIVQVLKVKYEYYFNSVGDALSSQVIAKSIIGRKMFAGLDAVVVDKPVSVSPITVDQLLALGVFKFEKPYLTCPFLWLYMLAEASHDQLLIDTMTDAVNYTPYHINPKSALHRSPNDEDWERFNALYRVLRDSLNEGETVLYSKLHDGIVWNSDFSADFLVRPSLKRVAHCSNRIDTKNIPAVIGCQEGNVPFLDFNTLFLNATRAPAADSFHALDTLTGPRPEMLQPKHYFEGLLSKDLMVEERNKSTLNSFDILLILTTFDSVNAADIPPSTGVVTKENFLKYYGEMAGRAFFLARRTRIDLNTATRFLLETVVGIGTAYAARSDLSKT
jgi:hypothetical protein